MKAIGWLVVLGVLLAVLSPISVYFGAHLTLQYLAWFLPEIYTQVTYLQVIGWVAFSSLILSAIKFGLAKKKTSPDDESPGIALLTQLLVIVFRWWLTLGLLWVSGWYTHWVFYT